MTEFAHLHVHTQYSLLDGFSHIPQLVQRAKELNMPAIGITDHGTLYGVIDFFNAANETGIKPIIGIEAYLASRGMKDKESQVDRSSTHLLLLAENQTGYQNLLKIASAAQLEGFYYSPRIDHDFLAAHAEGLICTSGCMSAEIPRALQRDNPDEAKRKFDWYFEVFGRDNFFVELQSHDDIPELERLNSQLIELGKRYNASFLATNDVHYINQADARYQDIMLCVQTGSLLSDPDRMKMTDNSYYLKSAEEMSRMFPDMPEAISNSLMIAERCQVDLNSEGYKLPEFTVPEGHTDETYLRELCEKGLQKRYGDHTPVPEVRERLEYELGIIDEMGFNAYFLIVWDLCRYAQEEGIWYNARGSAAGSIVAYALEITLVDPLEHGLIFERFLNPGRVSMPDIDLDFQDDQRYKMMEYCSCKYGEDKVAAIITFGKLKARAAVRDVGRVMDVPLSEVDRIAKLIPSLPLNTTIEKAIEEVPELKKEYQTHGWARDLLDTAQAVEGSIRNAGTHAAGVVITDKPIVDYIPLHRPTSHAEDTPIKTVTQFEMSTIDSLGLLKVDFLGLSSLTIMQRCCEMIKQRHGIELNLDSIPLEDPETYEMLGRGETAGVFQLEGSGMTRWVMEMKPSNLSHVIAMVALYRPGPMQFIPQFIARMHGEEEVDYRHEALAPILEETFGITVYQEQIMRAAMTLAGYTASDADILRKAVAKKKAKELYKNQEKFVKGAKAQGIPGEVADEIFNDWLDFARYGFPKGHAADYAVIAVETAYLKTHYPVEYMTALLSVYQDNTDKVAFYVGDCRNMGFEVLLPNINKSDWDFTIEDGPNGESCIRYGLGAIKNVGSGPVCEVIDERQENGPFEDITDLANRVDLRKVGKRALEAMIKAGALDSFGPRMALIRVMERAVSISTAQFQAADAGQISFFNSGNGLVEKIKLPKVDPNFNHREQLNWERDLIGLYLSDHPLKDVMKKLDGVTTHYSSQLPQVEHQHFVRVAGMVTTIRHHQTKKGDPMAFVSLEDTHGVIKLVIFPKTWERVSELVEFDEVIIVEGKVDAERGEPKVLVDKVHKEIVAPDQLKTPPPPQEKKPARSHLQVVAEETKAYSPQKNEARLSPKTTPIIEDQPEINEEWVGDTPPPPENFPEGWGLVWQDDDSTGKPSVAQVTTPSEEETEIEDIQESGISVEEKVPVLAADAELTQEETEKETQGLEPVIEPVLMAEPAVEIPTPAPMIPPPIEAPTPEGGIERRPSQMVTVVLRSMGDKTRDNLRMRRIYGMLISYPGNDRFAFYVIENNHGYRLEFPNDTTNLNDSVRARLREIVGEENVIIEPITIQ